MTEIENTAKVLVKVSAKGNEENPTVIEALPPDDITVFFENPKLKSLFLNCVIDEKGGFSRMMRDGYRIVTIGYTVDAPIEEKHLKAIAEAVEEVDAIAPIKAVLCDPIKFKLAAPVDWDNYKTGDWPVPIIEGVERYCLAVMAFCPSDLADPAKHIMFGLEEGELPPIYKDE